MKDDLNLFVLTSGSGYFFECLSWYPGLCCSGRSEFSLWLEF